MTGPEHAVTWALPGAITLQPEGRDTVLCLVGEVDAAVVEQFERHEGAEPVTVAAIDAGAVTFIGARGIALVLHWHQVSAAHGQPATLRSSSHVVQRVLELTGLSEILRSSGG